MLVSRSWNLNSTARLVLAFVVAITCGNFSTFADDNPVFRAGAATSNITPPLGQLVVGGWKPVPATHIHDELHARCIVLDDGNDKLVFVLCDNVGIPEEVFDLAKEQITEATGIPRSHCLMAATHTHSATTARGSSKVIKENSFSDYQKFLVSRIADGVRRAVNQLEPAKIGWGSVDEPSELFNRRWYVDDPTLLTNPFGGVDRVRMNPPRGHASLNRPAGPIDPEVSFISIQSQSGKPIALLANYSLHYVGGVPQGQVSADYFGYFAKFIEHKLNAEKLSPPFVGILSNGTSADVNNIDFKGKNTKRYAAYEKMQVVAEKIASRVSEAHEKITFQDWVDLQATETALPLKSRKPTQEMIDYFAEALAEEKKTGKPRHVRESNYAARIERLKDAPDERKIPLQVFQIGDLGIAAIPFETFTETGLEIKKRSPFKNTFTIELANGSFGYLPTPGQHRLGGYETWLGTSNMEIDSTVKIVNQLMELFGQLKKTAPDTAAK